MSRRSERVSNLIRNTIGELLHTKLSDPRIEPARVSITRVDVPEDLLTGKVYVSVIGTEAEQRRTVRALQHAAGRIQEVMMRNISLRHTPALEFVEDTNFKKTLETYALIDEVSRELRAKDEARQGAEPQEPDQPGPMTADGKE